MWSSGCHTVDRRLADGRSRYRLPVRPNAYTWRIVGRLGTPIVPHTFVASRLRWTFDDHRMRMMAAELGMIQLVPSGTGESFIRTMVEYDRRARAKGDAAVQVIADLSRSLEMRVNISRALPRVDYVEILPNQEDKYDFPARKCGRQLVLSRLQSWMTDRKIGFALPKSEDPNVWGEARVVRALSSVQMRAPKADSEEIISDDTTSDEVALAVAMVAWFAESRRPAIHDDVPHIGDAAGVTSAEQATILAELRRRKDWDSTDDRD